MTGVRFAPSPTGRFHVGNLRTAWISWKIARNLALPWIVRFEDIDGPRVVPGAKEAQLEDLSRLGMTPDEIVVQSLNHERHLALFLGAVAEGVLYPCTCSRKEIHSALDTLASAPNSPQSSVHYNGKCRNAAESSASAVAEKGRWIGWRFRSEDPSGVSDFVVARTLSQGGPVNAVDVASFVPGYHWACAIDDADGNYPWIVRASDLSGSLEPQRKIQQWMTAGASSKKLPAVFHTALVTQNNGHRLEKRTRGVTLEELLKNGINMEMLLKRFEESASIPVLETMHQASALVFNETRVTLTLRELLGEPAANFP